MFSKALRRFTLRWRFGLIVQGLLVALSLAVLVCVAFGAFDYVAPFSDKVRPHVTVALAALGAMIVLSTLAPVFFLRARDAAVLADRHTGPRKPVVTAFELSRGATAATPASPLRDFLTQRALEEGASSLKALSFPKNVPWIGIRRGLLQALAALALVGGLYLANGTAVKTIALRLWHPWEDIPPYSSLVFAVTPGQPKVVYGSDAELEVNITGGAIDQGVTLLTREDAGSDPAQAGAFAMGAGHFGQKLQRVVQPVQIAFAAGKARSRWIQVDVLRQPRFESATIKITPPAYAKLPVKEFMLGTADLVALAGSQVEARIVSNRPLSGAVATLTPPRSISQDKPDSVSANAQGRRELTLRWKVKSAALVRIDLKDITGAASAQPVELEQKLLPDLPPQVTLVSPAGTVLATPESEVPLEIEVQDDFGVARVDLVRKLTGFRDRGRTLVEDAVDRSYESSAKLNLAQLGVAAGETYEFYAEAHDHNPTLMGIGSSSVGRIQVISHEEYADVIRARTFMAEFQQRFAVLSQSIEQARQALEKTAQGDPHGADEAREALQKAQQLAEALGKDFVAYDAEKKLTEEARKAGERMKGMQERLAQAQAQSPPGQPNDALKAEAKKMLEEIAEPAQSAKEMAQQGKELSALGQVMEMAAEFRAMHTEQQKLTKSLEDLSNQIRLGDMRNAAQLDGLAQRQQQVLERWKAWDKELRRAAKEVPDKFAKFRQEALDFADKAEEAGIQKAMERAMAQAKKVSTPDTFVNSQFALVGMDSLLTGSSSMCQACNSSEPHFRMTMEKMTQSMAETLSQMLSGMCRRHGFGQKPGKSGMEGRGMSGGGESGVAMEGDSLLQAPVYGPGRMNLNGDAPSGESSGNGKGNAAKASVTPDSQTRIDSKATRTEVRRQISLRDVPERYRDAVRRFYGEDAVKETSAGGKP